MLKQNRRKGAEPLRLPLSRILRIVVRCFVHQFYRLLASEVVDFHAEDEDTAQDLSASC
jgi:hypothetical protein